MIQETGIVEKVEGRYAFIRAERTGSCENCASKSMCHPGGSDKAVTIQAINEIGATAGDTVKFEMQTSTILKTSLLLYVFPLILLVIGATVGGWLHGHFQDAMSKDAFSALSALIFLIASLIIVKLVTRKRNDDRYAPRIIQVIG